MRIKNSIYKEYKDQDNMHEYAVTENILELVATEAKKAGAGKISTIRLVIGELSTFVDESIQMYFDILSKGTVAEGARLEFKRVTAMFECKVCSFRYGTDSSGFDCPVCKGPGRLTDEGSEFYIESIEVEV